MLMQDGSLSFLRDFAFCGTFLQEFVVFDRMLKNG